MRERSAFGRAGLVKAHARELLLALLVVLGVVALGILIFAQNRAAAARDDALRSQAHSYDVMIRAQAVAADVANAEAALGRYVISGEKQLGRIYVDLWSQAKAQLDALDRETDDNPAQDDDIRRLRRAYAERGKELAEIAGYSNFKLNQTAYGLFYRARDTRALRAVTATLNRIINREHTLLLKRNAVASHAVARSNMTTQALALFGALLVVGVSLFGWFAAQALAERAAADEDAELERERAVGLRAAVESATAQLREEAHERARAEAQLRQIQKMEAVGQLTGGIAHDFNNMLAVVLGGLELAKRRLRIGSDDAERHIDSAIEGANRAAALTRQLLAFARAEALRPEALDAGRLIVEMSELLDRTLGDAINVRVSTSGAGWRVWVDSHQLENAVLNLAVNARDAMDGRGTMRIETGTATLARGAIGSCAAGDYVTISVIDTGHGMSPEVLDRVFEPFFTTKPVGKGTGLGLSQIFAFVRQSNGEITIDSAPSKGTTVTLYLPRHVQLAAPALASIPVTSLPAPRSTAALTVLVVEDDPRVRAATIDAVEELGHRAVACGDPSVASSLIAEIGKPDLILTDVLMPGQSGPEMIAELGDAIADVAVLFVTGYTGEAGADMLEGHKLLRKPFTLAGLARAIGEALAEPRSANAAEAAE